MDEGLLVVSAMLGGIWLALLVSLALLEKRSGPFRALRQLPSDTQRIVFARCASAWLEWHFSWQQLLALGVGIVLTAALVSAAIPLGDFAAMAVVLPAVVANLAAEKRQKCVAFCDAGIATEREFREWGRVSSYEWHEAEGAVEIRFVSYRPEFRIAVATDAREQLRELLGANLHEHRAG